MISENNTKSYCCEDISLIENYELAIADATQKWDCHHRAEVVNGIKMFSKDELKQLNLYFDRPAKELIFLTKSEHSKIHCEDRAKGGKISGKINGKINGKKRAKTILQYTKAGEFVREWESTYDVQRQLRIYHSSISKCCIGCRKYAGGFVWKFKKSIQRLNTTTNDISICQLTLN